MPTPYYPPVAPEVPNAQHNIAPELILRGTATLAQMAIAREKAQLDGEQMLTDAALKSRQLDIARENNLLDFQVQKQNADSEAQHYEDWYNVNTDPDNPHGMAGQAKLGQQRQSIVTDFGKRLTELDLTNPNPQNPVQAYLNYQALLDGDKDHPGYRLVDIPEIQFSIGKLDDMMKKQHTLSMKNGTYDESGQYVTSGEVRKIPVGQIIENLNDPDKSKETMDALDANGYGMTTTRDETRKVEVPLTSDWKRRDYVREWFFGKPKATIDQHVIEQQPSPSIRRYLEMGKGLDFSRNKARTPVAGVRTPDAMVEPLPTNGASTLPASADGKQEVTTRDVGDASAALFAETAAEKLKKSYLKNYDKVGFQRAKAKQYMMDQHIDVSDLPD